MNAVDRSVMGVQIEEVSSLAVETQMGMFHVLTCERGVLYAGWEISDALQGWAANSPEGLKARTFAEMVKRELHAYFCGDGQSFTVPVVFEGTPFQCDVWKGLSDIPYGDTWSYKDLALHIGRPLAVRAVGQANRANRVAVIIPCHRVIGANGDLVGYAGSATDLKAQLLRLEQQSSRIDGQTTNLVG